MKKLATIILASNRPQNLSQLLFNIQNTCDNPACVEVLVKIDDGDEAMRECAEASKDYYDLDVKFMSSPRGDGYYTLHHGYNALWKMSNPETYFALGISDEVRFDTKGWDTILRKYVGYFPDDLFRLKISQQKLRNYYYAFDCGPVPDNFSFLTRRWLELSEGWGECWGPDVWMQSIDFHLGQMYDTAAFRSIPIDTIAISGEEAGLGISKQSAIIRTRRIYQEWWRMCTPEMQQKFRRLATKMYAYIWAYQNKLTDFAILEDRELKQFIIEGKIDLFNKRVEVGHFFYHLSPIYVSIVNFSQLMRAFRSRNGVSFSSLRAYVVPSTERSNFLKYIGRFWRTIVISSAFFCSFLPNVESKIANPWLRLKMRMMISWHSLRRALIQHKYEGEEEAKRCRKLDECMGVRRAAITRRSEEVLQNLRTEPVIDVVSREKKQDTVIKRSA